MLNIANTIILDDTESINHLPLEVFEQCENIVQVNANDEIIIFKMRKKASLTVLGSRIFATDTEKLNRYISELNDVWVPQITDEKMASMVEVINNVIAEYTIMVAEEIK